MCSCHRCLLDVALRHTLEWREVANLLSASGFDLASPVEDPTRIRLDAVGEPAPRLQIPGLRATRDDDSLIGHRVYSIAVALAQRDRAFSSQLVARLARQHREGVAAVHRASLAEARALVREPYTQRDVGTLWGLATDPREELTRLAHGWLLISGLERDLFRRAG